VIEIAHALPGVKISHTVVDEISPTEEESEDANSSCHPVKKSFNQYYSITISISTMSHAKTFISNLIKCLFNKCLSTNANMI